MSDHIIMIILVMKTFFVFCSSVYSCHLFLISSASIRSILFLSFTECFPKGKCIFDSDGNTDLVATRDILGPTMGFTGTVHPAVFAFGTPDEVYNDVKEQIEVMGDSFIASPSCSIPANAPKENIDAMYAAIDEL